LFQDTARLRTDVGDDRCRADDVGDVIDVADKQPDAGEHEREGHSHRDPRDEPPLTAGSQDRPLHHQRVHERRHENAQGHLDGPVAQEHPQHPRRELTAGELQHDDGDREHQAGERDHRGDDGGQKAARPAGRPGIQKHAMRSRQALIERDQSNAQPDRGHDAQGRHQPKR